AGAGFTEAPDVEYTRILRAAGHQVTRYVTTATPDVNFLNTFDLVIISRSAPSGHYQTDESVALWHSLTKPVVQLGGYVIRANRLGYTYGNTIPDTPGAIRLAVDQPAHPIFAGVPLSGGVMVNPYADRVTYNGVLQLGISVNTDQPVDGAVVLATGGLPEDHPSSGGMITEESPAGTTMGNAAATATASKHLVFLTGSRESGITSEGAGIFDLGADGLRMFLNAVSYMAGTDPLEPPPLLTDLRPANGAVQHYAPWGLRFRATSALAGGIPADGITVTLNGTDVTAALQVSGTPQNREVAYNGLVTGTQYTGRISVRDATGRTTSQDITFDTNPAFPLPTEFAFPVESAVASAAGLRARIVQGYDAPNLANSPARAGAQLAGPLIAPATGEPYPDFATPSTDNPDGSYNQDRINWNVEAGFGPEVGNFQAPNFPDQLVPGTTEFTGHGFNIAAEIFAYLELPPGRYIMGVNSDDGFAVFTGVDRRDALRVSLGRFDGGRGAADTLFQFEVSQAGLYPFRLLYYQGGGQGSVEWFTVDPETNERVLINHRADPRAVRAWRQTTATERPYIASLNPAAAQGNVALNTPVSIVLQDNGAQVQEGSIQLSLSGQTVTPQVVRNGGQTTITYQPPQPLPNDTVVPVQLAYTDSAARSRSVGYSFVTRFVPEPLPQGANIVWVSFHPADDEPSGPAAAAGFTEARDVEYPRLLRAAGHQVTRYVTSAAPDVDFLNTFDLVIISRSVPSGHYQTAESTALWHAITKPTMVLGGYVLRGSRLGYTTGETIPDTIGPISLRVNNPAHPVFAGISLDAASVMTRSYARVVTFNGTTQRGISVNNNPVPAGVTVLAAVATPGDPALNGMIIAEYPPGTVMGNVSADTTAARRLVLLTGSRENDGLTAEGSGIYDLDGDGARILLNGVIYLAGLTPPAAPPVLSYGIAGGNLTLSWPAAGTDGFVLRGTPTLGPATWQNVPGEPVVNNGVKSVTQPTTDAARYFQLFRP
ncbi:MAG TPA: hypothetical protein PKE47_06695, partial [Verrucomicrobiota bacterium]|nr:hypothetical protein [Verrucomicrobiota bacterium]